MHISLTPELEASIKQKIDSGYYNNASEVICEALRFWEKNEELVELMKLEALRKHLKEGENQALRGEFVNQSVREIISEVKSG